MGMITDINIDKSGTVSAVVDGSKVQLDIHVLLMKVLKNVRTRLTTQYLDEVNEMNKVNNIANYYRDMMEGLRQAKSNGHVHYSTQIIELETRLKEKYGEEVFKEARLDLLKYGGEPYTREEFLTTEEAETLAAQLDERGIEYTKIHSNELMDGKSYIMRHETKHFSPAQVDTMVEDIRHKITSMNNLNSQNQIKVKMIEQFRNETIEWQKSLLDKLDRLFQKVNQ